MAEDKEVPARMEVDKGEGEKFEEQQDKGDREEVQEKVDK